MSSFFDPLGITNLPLWQDLCVPDIPGAMLSSFALIGCPNANWSWVTSKTKSNSKKTYEEIFKGPAYPAWDKVFETSSWMQAWGAQC